MMVTDGEGLPLTAHIDSASPAEVTLLETILDKITVGRKGTAGRPLKHPDRLIADRAYDSNPMRERLEDRGIEPIIPPQTIIGKRLIRTLDNFAATSIVGSSNVPLLGFKTSDVSPFAGKGMTSCMRALSISHVHFSSCGGSDL